MARRSTKSNKVSVNFKDVETRRTPAEGDYPLRVAEATKEKSNGGNEQIKFIFEIKAGEYKGSKLYLYCPLTDNSLWKLASVLQALGQDVPEDEMDIDLDELVDAEMMGVVHHETYNGRKQAKLGDWAPISELKDFDEGDGAKKSKKDKKKSKGDDAGDADEGKSDKKSKKGKSKDEPAADEKSPKKDKKGKKDKGDKKKSKSYNSDDVAGMDADDLQAIISKHDLDVDLDDFKSNKKKANAVIDALEAAGLIAG